MGLPNTDEVQGKWDQAKGTIKENLGRVVDDKNMEAEGQDERTSGKIQEGYGTARRKIGETFQDIGDAIKK
jgi:uncharacterized protein YjbJ (UPF0337 family)